MPENSDETNDTQMDMAAACLNRAYGENEPEYSLADNRLVAVLTAEKTGEETGGVA